MSVLAVRYTTSAFQTFQKLAIVDRSSRFKAAFGSSIGEHDDPMAVQERVLIAGAGPVGLVAAAHLARAGVPVTVFEAGPTLSEESRASTFHPPTLDMLHALSAMLSNASA
jgi:NADPH-dependent 2,4-dienoyl-CoA reductase/sulfur reductase-like enzyme